MSLERAQIENALRCLGEVLDWPGQVELLLVGGAAALLTGELQPPRVTVDCDVIRLAPPEASGALKRAAACVAEEQALSEQWFSDEVAQLSVLPDGWHTRRIHVGTFGQLSIYAAHRCDLIATKVYASREQDRDDVIAMNPSPEELAFTRTYLTMLKVPSRNADLDRLARAERFLEALEQPDETT